MPILNAKVIEDVFTSEQKRKWFENRQTPWCRQKCENMRQVAWVCIKDVKQSEFGIGGQALAAADVHWLQRGDAVA